MGLDLCAAAALCNKAKLPQVTDAERRLRALLVYEGFKPQEGYRLNIKKINTKNSGIDRNCMRSSAIPMALRRNISL